jgi:hypothetical protein
MRVPSASHDCEVTTETSCAVSNTYPGAEDEGRAFFKLDGELERHHRVLSRGSSMNTPTWRASCRCFIRQPTEGYPEVADL